MKNKKTILSVLVLICLFIGINNVYAVDVCCKNNQIQIRYDNPDVRGNCAQIGGTIVDETMCTGICCHPGGRIITVEGRTTKEGCETGGYYTWYYNRTTCPTNTHTTEVNYVGVCCINNVPTEGIPHSQCGNNPTNNQYWSETGSCTGVCCVNGYTTSSISQNDCTTISTATSDRHWASNGVCGTTQTHEEITQEILRPKCCKDDGTQLAIYDNVTDNDKANCESRGGTIVYNIPYCPNPVQGVCCYGNQVVHTVNNETDCLTNHNPSGLNTWEADGKCKGSPIILDKNLGFDCEDANINRIMSLVKKFYVLLKVFTPIILVITGSVDFLRATISSNAEDIDKNKKRFFNRLIIAVMIFLLASVFELIANILSSSGISESTTWYDCFKSLWIIIH